MIEIILAVLITAPIAAYLAYHIVWRRITKQIKRPVHAINGYAGILLTEHLGPLTQKQRERLEIIRDSSTEIKKNTGMMERQL